MANRFWVGGTGNWSDTARWSTTSGGAGGAPGSQYVVTGWVRATTGSGHVLNTDWYEMRTLTGT